MNKSKKINIKEENNSELFDIALPYLKKWYLYVISIIIALVVVNIYIRYTMPTYTNSASILINENKKSTGGADISILEELDIIKSSSNIENDMEILKAYSVIEPVVDSLQLNVSVFRIGENSKLRRLELFETRPCLVDFEYIDTTGNTPTISFIIEKINKNEILIEFPNGETKKIQLGEYYEFAKKKIGFIISKSIFWEKYTDGEKFEYQIIPKLNAVMALTNKLKIDRLNNESSIIKLSLDGYNIDRINTTLNEIIKSYQRDAFQDRNMVKTKTSDFIKERIKFLVDELTEVEKFGEDYKKDKGILDLQVGLNNFISSKGETEENLNEVSVQLSLVIMLIEYMNGISTMEELLPANIGFQDENINQMSEQYNKLILDRKKLLQGSKSTNPLVVKIEEQIISLRSSITTGLRNLKRIYDLKISAYNRQYNKVSGQLSTLPQFEREYRSILRQQQIKESLYLYLLQKREENEIEMAASVSNIKVIQPPIGNGKLIAPKGSLLYTSALIFALLFPTGIIFIGSMLDNKLKSESDVTGLNIIGQIPKTSKTNSIMAVNDRSYLSESFRMLRTNINFMIDSQIKCPVIAVSSTLPSEGKTFISINLAQTFASVGKQVIVVGLDLRVPKLKDYFDIIDERGVSNFIADSTITPEMIIHNSGHNENLFFINSGSVPPNPAEILLKPRFSELINYLKENYDLIIFDTSPIGLISDCLPVIKKDADLLIFIARIGLLDKRLLEIPKSYLRDGLVKDLNVVLNYAKPLEKRYGYGYGYGYGYTYAESYFGEKHSKWHFLTRIKNWFKAS
jgi:tyrosine-protein kinase Etk/Wzc